MFVCSHQEVFVSTEGEADRPAFTYEIREKSAQSSQGLHCDVERVNWRMCYDVCRFSPTTQLGSVASPVVV